MGTLFLCYRFRPVRSFFTKWSGPRRFHKYIQHKYPERYTKTQDYINTKAQHLAEWKYFRPIPKFLGVQPQRFTLALAENVILYKASLPFTIPLQIWGIVRMMQQKNAEKVSPIDVLQAIDDSGGPQVFSVEFISDEG